MSAKLGKQVAGGSTAMRPRDPTVAVASTTSAPVVALALSAWLALPSPLFAQAAAGQPVRVGDVVVSGSLRSRAYDWNWFGASADGSYAYPGSLFRVGLSESRKTFDWQLEFGVPFLIQLPSHAIAAGAQGQLGLGGTYFAANDSAVNPAAAFVKQASIRFNGLGGIPGQSLQVGRLEFNDGTEIVPKNPSLAVLKRDRISQRLLGTFGFSDVGRSFDGVQYGLSRGSHNVTVLAVRPTQGVFQVGGWSELNVNVFYGALTTQLAGEKTKENDGEWRLFGLVYQDFRGGAVKTDNRPLAVRRADTGSINIGTVGGHLLRTVDTPAGAVDALLWGAVQTGSWGSLSHRAAAFAVEGGWQPPILPRLKPWFRGGHDYGSGDGNPADQKHGTFFQVLPTPRVYARFPFFNLMNTADTFGELILRPSNRLTARGDIHVLRLADANDLWYSGGGAFQPGTFGYTGRPSNGQSGLATLYDASGDYSVNPHLAVGAYYGYASGKLVTQAIYPNGNSARFGYLELLLRF